MAPLPPDTLICPGPDIVSKMCETFADVLLGTPEAPALYIGATGRTFSRGALQSLVSEFAHTLEHSFGVGPGDVVALIDLNTASWVGMFCGCLRAPTSGSLDNLANLLRFARGREIVTHVSRRSPQQVEFVVAYLGITCARASAAPLNPALTEVRGLGHWVRCCRAVSACRLTSI